MAEKVEELLAQAGALLPRRPSAAEAFEAQAKGALLIDIRGDDQRRAGGLIPGAIVVPGNVLECRCDPASPSVKAPSIRTFLLTSRRAGAATSSPSPMCSPLITGRSSPNRTTRTAQHSVCA